MATRPALCVQGTAAYLTLMIPPKVVTGLELVCHPHAHKLASRPVCSLWRNCAPRNGGPRQQASLTPQNHETTALTR
ncbi:hypothetical protein F5144DRAFT_54981 [Chaetomium tenue]|uniref:Uncharacterized protein n=1 Tax=Chaetomium tenue TaxID=1854479 RepID=A0ACB7PQS1_9PEZI|nr:hypothetical protein F5144DRAFT_54981 [Chaetomium globosum]